nr:uncharacterized protein LOC109984125 [Labrus bergylta]
MVAGMLMPVRDLRAIYEVLFRDGVMVSKKDKRPQAKHPEVEGVSNLQVIRAMGSLKSRGYVKETFAWRHFYWYLTNEGIVYLRDFLRLPPEIVPASLQRIRKPAATLSFAHRAAQVQTVEGPTSYVPKPGRRGESESQEAHAERQGYRHKMMGPGEREGYSDRTPRFRGRPQAAGSIRPKASWEVEDQPQSLFRKGNVIPSESVMMEESRVKRVSRQMPDVSSERPVSKSSERRVTEVQKEKAPVSAQVQREDLKQDVSLTSLSSKPALPLMAATLATGAAWATASKIPPDHSSPKTNKEKLNTPDEKACVKPAITTLPGTEVKEEKTKKAIVVDPIKSAEVKITAEAATEKVKPQAVFTSSFSQETSKVLIEPANATPVSTKSVKKDAKDEKTKTTIIEPATPAAVKALSKKEASKLKAQEDPTIAFVDNTSKALADSSTTTPVITEPANKDVKENETTKVIAMDPINSAEVKARAEPAAEKVKPKAFMTMAASQETSKPLTNTATPTPAIKTTKPDNKDEQVTKKVNVDPADKVKAQAVITKGTVKEISNARATPVSTKPVNVEIKDERLKYPQ